MVVVVRRIDHEAGGSEVVGRVGPDGEALSGAGALEDAGVFGWIDRVGVDGLTDAIDGPYLVATSEDGSGPPQDQKSWMPYEGPRGGSGWKNVDDGRVEYSDEPPGETVDPDDLSDDDLRAFAENHGIDAGPDDIREAMRDELGGDGAGEVSEEEIESKTNEIVQEFLENAEPRPDDAEDINLGFCNAVANRIFEELGEPEGMKILEAHTMGARHQWVEYNGKHYDAEVPGGIDDHEDLPIWDRFGRPNEPEVIEEGDGETETETHTVAGADMSEGDSVSLDIEDSGTATGTVDDFVDVDGTTWITIETERGSLNHYSESDIEDWQPAADAKSWIPYRGPQGGEGWQNTDTGEVLYDDEPPGEIIGADEFVEAAVEAGADPDEVRRVAEQELGADGPDPDEMERRVSELVERADRSSLSRNADETLDSASSKLARRANDAEAVERIFEHTNRYNDTSGRTGLGEGRASFSTVASSGHDPGTSMQLPDDVGESTVFHEAAHGLADAFGFDTTTGNSIAHRYPDEGLPDWDFGGEHERKRDYMLTDMGSWDDRGTFGVEDYRDAAEDTGVASGELSIGDRVAFEGDSGVVEGTVAPSTRPISSADQLEVGEEITAAHAERISGNTWGRTVRDFDGLEVQHTLSGGGWLVVGRDESWPLPDGADPDAYERENDNVIEVIDINENRDAAVVSPPNHGFDYLVDVADITDAESGAQEAIRTPEGGEYRLEDFDGSDERMLMAGAEDRDWVDARDYWADSSWRGETVRFSFGAQDTTTEGVVSDETDAQVTIAYHDDGERKTKKINKSQAYNQQLWFAQDDTEFVTGTIRGDREPPGFRRARYENFDLTEPEVDWNTSIQYHDPADREAAVATGDLVLLRDPDGDRHPVKVTDKVLPFGDEDRAASQIQGDFPSTHEWGNTFDASEETGSRVEIGEDTDWDVMGVSKRDEWVEPGTAAEGDVGPSFEPFDEKETREFWEGGLPDGPQVPDHADGKVMLDAGEGSEEALVNVTMDGNVTMSTGMGRYFIDLDEVKEEGGLAMVRTTGAEKEDVGDLADVVESVYAGEGIEGGFKPDALSELQPGDEVEVSGDAYGETRVVEVGSVEGDAAETTDGEPIDFRDVGRAARSGAGGGPAPESRDAVEELMAEANRAWHSMVTRYEERGDHDGTKQISTGYSETNAHETLAKTMETLQSNTRTASAMSLMSNHPDLFEAATNIVDPSPAVKEKVNRKHEARPWSTPYDSDEVPFEETEDRSTVSLSSYVEAGDEFHTDQVGWAQVVSVSGTTVEVEGPGGETATLSGAEALGAVPWTDIDTSVVEVEP